MVTIGVVIATPGRKSILRTLQSISYQGLIPGDDILIVGDGHHEPTAKLIEAMGPPFRYMATKQTRTWGHDQINYGLKRVGGDVLVLQDDDDIFAPRAFDEVRKLAARFPNAPILGRVKTPFLGILWSTPDTQTQLDGHCIVVPNNKEKMGFFTREYEGDQAWIKTSLEPYESVYWADRVWTITRSQWKLYPHKLTPAMHDKYNVHYENFFREFRERLDPVGGEGRQWQGENDWTWFFFDGKLPVAAIKMFQVEETVRASISFVPGAEQFLPELAEFAAWAGQGLAVWMHQKDDDYEVLAALQKTGYGLHSVVDKKVEYIHDWPPKFFAQKPEAPTIISPHAEG